MIKKYLVLLVFGLILFGCILKPATPQNLTLPPVNDTPPIPVPNETEVQNWEGMQMKFTYVGTQEKLIPSVGISVAQFDRSKFQINTSEIDYSNDDIEFKEVQITKDEMQTAVTTAFDLEFMRNPTISDDPAVSFMFYNATSNTTTEFLLTAEQGNSLAVSILNSLTTSKTNVSVALSGYG